MNTIIEEKPAQHGAIGYTDFTAIYISAALTQEEQDLVRIHECSHIWLGHHIRGETFKQDRRKQGKDTDHTILNIAMDLEIAKHIYTPQDDVVITRPHSRLLGAINTIDTNRYPSCLYFEEYYEELEKLAIKDESFSFDGNHNIFPQQPKNKKNISKEALIAQAKKNAKKQRITASIQYHQARLDAYTLKPTIASEIDAVFGRFKVARIKSYRRPNRRESDFFQKGVISVRKTPSLMVYVDRSGSFDPEKTSKATETLTKLLQQYRGRIRHDVLYFNDTLLEHDPGFGSGGTNHQVVLEDIVRTNPSLSLIITDDDDGLHTVPDSLPSILVVAVGCDRTSIASKINAKEVCV